MGRKMRSEKRHCLEKRQWSVRPDRWLIPDVLSATVAVLVSWSSRPTQGPSDRPQQKGTFGSVEGVVESI